MSKFYNTRTGSGFSSKLEESVYQILTLREKAGEIRSITQQVTVELICGIRWKVDFAFIDVKTKKSVWAEAKGCETDRYRLCLKLWAGGFGPGPLEIWKGRWEKPMLVEIVTPKRRPR